jgi:DNA-binding LytR/AlgR family response regulator
MLAQAYAYGNKIYNTAINAYLLPFFCNLLAFNYLKNFLFCYTILKGGDPVKIVIEIVDTLTEDEVVIRCCSVNETVQNIQKYVLEQSSPGTKIIFYKQNQEFFFPLDDVLFFETEGENIYAHTADDAYQIKYRLYELEQILPRHFVRAAKSTIVNITRVYSITRNLTTSSPVNFTGSHKHVYVSRHYYQQLRERLNERSRFEG